MSWIVPTAYAAVDFTAFGSAIDPIISNIVNPLVELMFAVALLVFAYGVLQLVFGEPSSEQSTTGKHAIWGGLIGMFIMLSAWVFIYIIANTVKSL